ncbi:MAG: cadherin-like beta sandwich domain-containing protein, partial [Oscillospiraceae bacterium]
KTEYPIRIHRVPPSTDASLSALTIKDNFGNDLSKMDGVGYSFNSQNTEYMLSVPFETKTVTFTPTATFTNISSIKIGSYTVKNATESVPYALNDKDGIEAVFKIVVTPQKDDDPALVKTYTVRVMRKAPSTDARLSKLTVTGVDSFKPMFVPKQLSYTANISKGGGAIITATTNNKFATLTIRGASAVSGTATDPINLMDVNETVPVVVTAQDGKTTATYQIALTDLNLIELSGNADLKDLKVTPGVPSPTAFMPSVTAYNVAVPEDVAAVEIFPVPADPAADYKVYNGSVEIGDQNGNYAQSIADGENPFTVKVTSPDGKTKKDYTLNVYRNDEANSGVLKPITPEDINFEVASPIIVDISKYSRVSADVFNTLRDKYPDKTIIFEGNDYSLTFNGKDILRSIPSTTIYDFSLSFTPPAAIADKLRLVLTPYPENALLENVYVTFGYHGDLPAPAALNLSIGQKYGGRTLYWHYFNEERNRIDYYGVVYANTRGNFSLRLTHMSTYIVSTGILYGSENRSGEIALSNNGKKNPNTFGFMAVNSDDFPKGNNAFNSTINDESELASSNARIPSENSIFDTQLLSFDIKNNKFDPLNPCFLQDLQRDVLQSNNLINAKRQGDK